MTEFRPAVRQNAPLLLGLAGGTGSGKTMSALRLATGLAGGKKFALIDTENGRALHYADQFTFDHARLDAPFTPDAYAEAIEAADSAGYPVIVVDSASHEHAGDGGLLDMHTAEFERMGGREAVKMAAWVKPKQSHKRFVSRLLQLRAHVILCFRAEEKIELVKDAQGKLEVRPKRGLTGLDGWMPVCEKTLPYELTLSALLVADRPGVPRPIKLQEQHRPMVPLDAPLGEETGRLLGAWAAGSAAATNGKVAEEAAAPAISDAQRRLLHARKKDLGLTDDQLKDAIEKLTGQRSTTGVPAARFDELLASLTPTVGEGEEPEEPSPSSPTDGEQSQFEAMVPSGAREHVDHG